ncbi:MAG: hypothetical protein E7449_00465 [Ruminococcaceae bacterium]|nr:hypothetical protein [Oscillospiraceae bacterium]
MKKIVFMVIALCLLMSACSTENQTGVWVCVRELEYRDASWMEPNPVVLGERTYDKHGRLVESYENRSSDIGWEAYHNRFSYDSQGRLVFRNRYKDETDEKRYNEEYSDQLFYYNEDGNLIRRYVYDSDGKLAYKVTNEYDEMGRIISSKSFSATFGMDEIYDELVYSYSEDGRMCDERRYHRGKLTDHVLYFYDETGNLVMEKTKYDEVPHGTSPDWHVTEYRPDGKIERTYDLYDNGHTSNENRCVYDENGKILERYAISSRGMITARTTYEYDENDRLIAVYEYTISGEKKEQRRYEYRQNADKQVRKTYYAGRFSDSEYTKYDEHGNLIECGGIGKGRYRVYEWVFLPGVTEVEDQGIALPEYPPQWVR